MSGNDSNTKLLLDCDGTNGSTSFPDAALGATAHTITANGNAQVTTTDPKFGTGSAILDGTGDYLSVGSPSDLLLLGNDSCIDFWLYIGSSNTNQYRLIDCSDPTHTTNLQAVTVVGTSIYAGIPANHIAFFDFSGSNRVNTDYSSFYGSWTHVCIDIQSGRTVTLFLDGVYKDQQTMSTTISAVDAMDMGRALTNAFDANCKIDEMRISKGTRPVANPDDPLFIPGVLTDGFTPPSGAYTPLPRTEYSHTDPFINGVTATEYSHTDPFINGEKTRAEYSHADIEYRGDGIMEYFFDLRDSAGVQVDTATGTPPQTVFTDIVQAPSPGDYTLYVRSVQTFKNMSDVVSETFYPFTMGVSGIELPFPNEVLSLAASKRPAGAILLTWSYNENNEAIAPASFEVYLDAVFNQSVSYTAAGNYSVTIPALPETSTVFKVTAKTGTQETTGLSVTETPDSTAPLDNPFTWIGI